MAALTLAASAAHATSFIGLQQDAGPIVTVTSSPGSASFFGTFGQFEQVSVTAFGQPTTVLPTLLQGSGSVTNNGGAANAGMLTMYITSTGYTAPLGSLQFTSGFATVDLTQGWTETSRTFLDPGNGIFTLAMQLGSATFTTVNSEVDTVIANTGAGTVLGDDGVHICGVQLWNCHFFERSECRNCSCARAGVICTDARRLGVNVFRHASSNTRAGVTPRPMGRCNGILRTCGTSAGHLLVSRYYAMRL
jgi:hypothetical protein